MTNIYSPGDVHVFLSSSTLWQVCTTHREFKVFPGLHLLVLLSIYHFDNFLLFIVNLDGVSPTHTILSRKQARRTLCNVRDCLDAGLWCGYQFIRRKSATTLMTATYEFRLCQMQHMCDRLQLFLLPCELVLLLLRCKPFVVVLKVSWL